MVTFIFDLEQLQCCMMQVIGIYIFVENLHFILISFIKPIYLRFSVCVINANHQEFLSLLNPDPYTEY